LHFICAARRSDIQLQMSWFSRCIGKRYYVAVAHVLNLSVFTHGSRATEWNEHGQVQTRGKEEEMFVVDFEMVQRQLI
jgi:hypothetical protein